MSDLDPAVYRKAADVLRAGGWTKGTYESGSQHCTVGALRVARGQNALVGSSRDDDRWTQPLAVMLGFDSYPGLAPGAVVNWNDREGRTAEDVILLLEQAAEKLEADQ